MTSTFIPQSKYICFQKTKQAEREKKGMDFQHWEVIQWEYFDVKNINTWLPGAKEALGQERVLVPKVLDGAYPDPARSSTSSMRTKKAKTKFLRANAKKQHSKIQM